MPPLAHGFRDWLRWLSSVIDAGGAGRLFTPQTSLAGVGGGKPPMPAEEEPSVRLRAEQSRSSLLPQPVAVAVDRHHIRIAF